MDRHAQSFLGSRVRGAGSLRDASSSAEWRSAWWSGVGQMSPHRRVQTWVEAFNRADVDALAAMYTEDAINHQVANEPVIGREAIRAMFATDFAQAEMVCIPENIFEDGDWAILEWRDPKGLRGCGFFQIIGGQIAFQRGYWDKLSFLKLHGLERDA
jgi:limonene-1,2-epoxide hydrolase